MTRRKAFDRFMLSNSVGLNPKLARLTDAEFRAWVCGVLPIASMADQRGAFMLGSSPATAEDICNVSIKTTRKTAESLLKKLRDMGMLEHDGGLGGEWVHDWDLLNPAPKTDRTNAKRQAEWRARNGSRNAVTDGVTHGVTGARNADVTPPEVEVGSRKEETPHRSPRSGGTTDGLFEGFDQVTTIRSASVDEEMVVPVRPSRPEGKRGRDQSAYLASLRVYDQEVAEFAACLFPDVPAEAAIAAVQGALGFTRPGERPTADQIKESAQKWISQEAA